MKRIWPVVLQRGSWLRGFGVLLGLVLTQAVLYGPSMTGSKILLPLDLLALPDTYLPNTSEYQSVVPQNVEVSDLLYQKEPERQFIASEFRAGRLPLWTPYHFAGAPFANFPKYSPFTLLYCLFPSPVTLGWIQLCLAIVAGTGTYLFCRRILQISYWPSAVAAVCYPMTGFFILLLGFPNTYPVAWLPWSLLATDGAIRRPWGTSALLLAPLTGVILISGQVDAAGHVLLASGIYAIWCVIDSCRRPPRVIRIVSAAASVATGWVLGILMAAPYLLPLGEYALSGLRLDPGSPTVIDRPPVGVSELPRMVLPRFYGTREQGWCHIGASTSWIESSALAYSGLLATLVAAPLAWCSPRHRSINILLLVLTVFSASWILDLPGLVELFKKIPVLNLRAHNRFVLVASFAILVMAALGLEALWSNPDGRRRRWFLLTALVPLMLGGWCAYRMQHLPESVDKEIEETIAADPTERVSSQQTVDSIRESFRKMYREGAVLCGVAVAAWILLFVNTNAVRWMGPILGGLMVLELLWFARSADWQSDPSLYFPRIPALTAVAQSSDDRVLGVLCLPPKLNQTHGLREIRGYDAIDPALIVELLDSVSDARSNLSPSYARTLNFLPLLQVRDDGRLGVPGVVSMLNVRYLIFQGDKLPLPDKIQPWLHLQDYWVIENHECLPRAFVPRRVQTISSKSELLARLAADTFDPRQQAYVDQAINLPESCRGVAEVVEEIPRRVKLTVDMQTAGLVVLADQWSSGWRAELNGRPADILRVNYALRGVEVPSGRSTLVFVYEPESLTWGLRGLTLALAVMGLWLVLRLAKGSGQ